MANWRKIAKTAAIGAGIGALYATNPLLGVAVGAGVGGLMGMGKNPKDRRYTSSGWTPEQQALASYMAKNALPEIQQYKPVKQNAISGLQGIMNMSTDPMLRERVYNPMQYEHQQQLAALNTSLGQNFWGSSRAKALSDFENSYNIQKAKLAADLSMQANMQDQQMRLQAIAQLLGEDPAKLYTQFLANKPIDTTVVPAPQGLLANLLG